MYKVVFFASILTIQSGSRCYFSWCCNSSAQYKLLFSGGVLIVHLCARWYFQLDRFTIVQSNGKWHFPLVFRQFIPVCGGIFNWCSNSSVLYKLGDIFNWFSNSLLQGGMSAGVLIAQSCTR